MVLGQMLMDLIFILATSPSTFNVHSLRRDSQLISADTLVICPLATMLNWEKEIKLHFPPQEIPYYVLHGRNQGDITQKELITSMFVLKTYEMIGKSGNNLKIPTMIDDLNIFWFRVVLDELQ